jgi:hypothetical protein
MAAFHTGQRVSRSGTYNFAGRMNSESTCQPTQKEKVMPLSKGDVSRHANDVILLLTGLYSHEISYSIVFYHRSK